MRKTLIPFALFIALSAIFFLDVRLLHYLRYSLLGLKIPGIHGMLNSRELAGIGYAVDFILSFPLTVVLSYFLLRKIEYSVIEKPRDFLARFQRRTAYGILPRRDPEPLCIMSSKSTVKTVIDIFAALNMLVLVISFIGLGMYVRYELLGIPFISSGHTVQPAFNVLISLIFSIPFFLLFPVVIAKIKRIFEKLFGPEITVFLDTLFK